MNWITNIVREIFGLFVDDGSFVLAILIWLVVVRWTLPYLRISPIAVGTIFFAGLALILVENATRYSRRRQLRK